VINKIPPWIYYIENLQKKETNYNSSRWIQFATVGLDNKPRVRTVVFRGWDNSYEMNIYTDKRSQKYTEIQSNNKVEICWLFPKSKCQFRLSGYSSIDSSDDTLFHWDQLNNQAKSMWGWPSPGNKSMGNDNKLFSHINAIDNFVLIKINILHVDQLILKEPIHLRRRWIRKKDWNEEYLNP
tara:strand:- start:860 stop:1405 length:546 start_codon:yes stop_codon:yes gene_type:complete